MQSEKIQENLYIFRRCCNCVCAACKRSLVAKLGRGKRVRHFAHYAERDIVLDCSAQKANESGLHLMAKKIVKESTYINLPEIQISARRDSSRNEDDWEQLQPLILEKKRKLQFSNAETEVRYLYSYKRFSAAC